MTKRDPRDLLVDATPQRPSELDLDHIDRRATRRRVGKLAGSAVTAVALVLIGVIGVPQLFDGSVIDGPAVDPVTEPEQPTEEPTARGNAAPSSERTTEAVAVPQLTSVLELGEALAGGGQHVVVEDGTGLTIISVETQEQVQLPGWSLASEPGLAWTPPGPVQVRNGELRATAGDGLVDVTNGEVVGRPDVDGVQHRVGALRFSPGDPSPILLRSYLGADPTATTATWPGGGGWSISADRTVITYCPDGELDCDLATFDTVTGETGGTNPGCHVADTSVDGFVMTRCGSVLSISELATGRTFNREPGFDGTWDGYTAITAAVWSPTAENAGDEVLVEARTECGAPVVLRGEEGVGALQPVGFPEPVASRLVGWTTDGRAIVRTVSQGCGELAGDEDGSVVWLERTDGSWTTLAFPADDVAEVRLYAPIPWAAEQETTTGMIAAVDLAGELVLEADGGDTRLPLAGTRANGQRFNVVGVTTTDGEVALADLAEQIAAGEKDGVTFELRLVDGEVAWIEQL